MSSLQNVKIAVLSVLIVIGLLASSSRAHAQGTETLVVAGGCFWCVEADFEGVPGVEEVVSGFTGGMLKNPNYKQVSRGDTGHYEAAQIIFDPDRISRDVVLAKFLRSIDPTDAGGQFCDRGNSYRTAIFTSGPDQTQSAEQQVAAAGTALGQKIVTPILPSQEFYPAAEYHQDYYKGKKIVFTRFGPKRQSEAYKAYRKACGRDDRVRQLWGEDAPFVNG